MINIRILSEIAVEGQDFKEAFVVSIVSPGREHPKMIGAHVHRFHFHDVGQAYELPDGKVIMPMSEVTAEAIVEIAIHHRYCSEWVIQCEAGVSRSPAVAIGLSKYIKMVPNRRMLKKMFPLYNKWVAGLIERAMEIRVKELTAELDIHARCG